MQPPIPLGTMLQKRYRVTKILGQGGFGRTYLAQDTACFDEQCVLKEFTPNDRGKDALKKSKELFQREAQVLYQINHPQIPKFRANFEEQRRLFLVQEYAEGQTVAKTLSERLKASNTFGEAEVVEFLHHMLPVLTHIHNMGIIHRDISPDNIIFRDRDKLPVLIDFGVVKAGVTQLEVSTEIHQGTTVGKAGYAPNEQLQTGEAYANSDLYALAVTVVVMMTGRKPESLIDKSTMNWKWHQWVPTLSPWFAKILNKMLSRVPSNRYQSATEVLQALRSVAELLESTPPTNLGDRTSGVIGQTTGYPNGAATTSNGAGSPPLSHAGRKTTGINPQATSPTKYRNLLANNQNNQERSSLSKLLSTPWGMAVLAGGIVIGVIIVPFFLLFRSMAPQGDIKSPAPAVSNSPSATDSTGAQSPPPSEPVSEVPSTPPVESQTPPPAASPSAAPAIVESLAIAVGTPVEKDAILNPDRPVAYTVSLQPGQQLEIDLTANPTGATMNFLAPNNAPVDFKAQNIVKWEGEVPIAGEYRIELTPPAGSTSTTNCKLKVLVNVPASPAPTASP
jgi:serine/threonine protein kinase